MSECDALKVITLMFKDSKLTKKFQFKEDCAVGKEARFDLPCIIMDKFCDQLLKWDDTTQEILFLQHEVPSTQFMKAKSKIKIKRSPIAGNEVRKAVRNSKSRESSTAARWKYLLCRTAELLVPVRRPNSLKFRSWKGRCKTM